MKKLKKDFTIISGPCSAETEDQVFETAKQLSQIKGISLFRAGIWKPRTRPGGFEGIGLMGLKWLQNVKKEFNLDAIVEVAQPEHVELCLMHGITNMWIGARTTSNPFSVSKLADSLNDPNISIGVKNPISPDFNLWVGAIERIQKRNVKKVFAIHRGFYPNSNSKYRNDPMWELPLRIKDLFPEIQLICDPSHICGNRHGILQIAKQAINLQYNGLMIESHINPNTALTDSKQQLTPAQLKNNILDQLTLKQDTSIDSTYLSTLKMLREKIDIVDTNLINTLKTRMELVDIIGKNKKKQKVSILQPDRWNEVLKNRMKYGSEKGLSKDFIKNIFENIHVESIKKQS